MSLRLKLTTWYTTILIITLIILGSLLYFYMQYNLTKEIDHSLATKAVEIFKSIKIQESTFLPLQKIILPDADIFAATPDIYLQAVNKNGEIVSRSSNLGKNKLPLTLASIEKTIKNNSYYKTYSINKGKIRIYHFPIYYDEDIVGILQVARPLNATQETLIKLRYILFISSLFAVIIAASTGLFLASIALKPIKAITKEASTIGKEKTFQRRVPYEGPNDEIGQLVNTFNEMLARIEDSYSKLEKAYNSEKRFVSDASHELRTPLTTIRGNIEYLQKALKNQDNMTIDALADIKSEAERMSRLVNDLLALARADAGQIPEMNNIIIKDLILEIIRNAIFLKNDTNFIYENPEWLENTNMYGNRDYLKQLFIILLDNAFKYTSKENYVKFNFYKDNKNLTFIIEDNGYGIPEKDLPYIFNRFYQTNKNRSNHGAGLGLSIAKWICDIHNSTISVKSEKKEGTIFTINFYNIF